MMKERKEWGLMGALNIRVVDEAPFVEFVLKAQKKLCSFLWRDSPEQGECPQS
jgi:hypothetical protein